MTVIVYPGHTVILSDGRVKHNPTKFPIYWIL